MKKIFRIVRIGLMLTGILIVSGHSRGAEWKYVSTAGDGNQLFYEPASLDALTYDVVNVRVKYRIIYKSNIMNYAYSISLLKINCFQRKLTSVVISDYDEEGALIGSVSSPGDPWYPITQDSLYGSLYDRVCADASYSKREGK